MSLDCLDPKTLSAVVSAIRKSFAMSLDCKLVLHKAVSDGLGPRGGKKYYCKQCQMDFPAGEVQVDHIEPVVPVHMAVSEMTLKEYYRRCFASHDNLQVLCLYCHKKKSREENKLRTEFRKIKKTKVTKR